LGELGDDEGGVGIIIENRDSGGFGVSSICLRYVSGSLEAAVLRYWGNEEFRGKRRSCWWAIKP